MHIKGNFAEVMISEQEIAERIKTLAKQIDNDYKDKNPLVIGVLKGCCMFFADLVREMEVDVDMDFIAVSSYGSGKESSGTITLTKDLTVDCTNRNVLIIEDIVDSGLTIQYLQSLFASKNVASFEVATLLDKPSRRKVDVDIKYVGFTIPNKFIFGYGLDYDEKMRGLRDVCVMKE